MGIRSARRWCWCSVPTVTASTSARSVPSITALDNGRFAVSWLRLAGNNGDVFIQAFDNDGTRDDDGSINGADVQITANNLSVPNRDPIVTALDDGRFLLSWVSPKTISGQQPAGARQHRYAGRHPLRDRRARHRPEPHHDRQRRHRVPTKVTLFDNDGRNSWRASRSKACRTTTRWSSEPSTSCAGSGIQQ